MNVQCKLCDMNLVFHKTNKLRIKQSQIKHKEKTVEMHNRQSLVISFANVRSVSKCRSDATRAEKISRLLLRIVTEDVLPLNSVEGGSFSELSWSTSYHCGEQQLQEWRRCVRKVC